MKQLPDIITSFEGIVAYMKYARAFVLVIAARVFSRPSTSSFRARNVAFPIRFLNFFTASPATLATIGTGIFALIGIIFQAMSRLSCTFFQSDVSQCVGPRKFWNIVVFHTRWRVYSSNSFILNMVYIIHGFHLGKHCMSCNLFAIYYYNQYGVKYICGATTLNKKCGLPPKPKWHRSFFTSISGWCGGLQMHFQKVVTTYYW